MGVDRVHLNKVLRGERPLSPSILQALKLKKVYRLHDRYDEDAAPSID